MNTIQFTIPGPPIPKARARVANGHAYTPKRTKEYEAKVKALALVARQKARQRVWSGPVRLQANFYMKNPEKRPDIDNLLKSVTDACNGVVFEDDSQIVEVRAWKRSSFPGAFKDDPKEWADIVFWMEGE